MAELRQLQPSVDIYLRTYRTADSKTADSGSGEYEIDLSADMGPHQRIDPALANIAPYWRIPDPPPGPPRPVPATGDLISLISELYSERVLVLPSLVFSVPLTSGTPESFPERFALWGRRLAQQASPIEVIVIVQHAGYPMLATELDQFSRIVSALLPGLIVVSRAQPNDEAKRDAFRADVLKVRDEARTRRSIPLTTARSPGIATLLDDTDRHPEIQTLIAQAPWQLSGPGLLLTETAAIIAISRVLFDGDDFDGDDSADPAPVLYLGLVDFAVHRLTPAAVDMLVSTAHRAPCSLEPQLRRWMASPYRPLPPHALAELARTEIGARLLRLQTEPRQRATNDPAGMARFVIPEFGRRAWLAAASHPDFKDRIARALTRPAISGHSTDRPGALLHGELLDDGTWLSAGRALRQLAPFINDLWELAGTVQQDPYRSAPPRDNVELLRAVDIRWWLQQFAPAPFINDEADQFVRTVLALMARDAVLKGSDPERTARVLAARSGLATKPAKRNESAPPLDVTAEAYGALSVRLPLTRGALSPADVARVVGQYPSADPIQLLVSSFKGENFVGVYGWKFAQKLAELTGRDVFFPPDGTVLITDPVGRHRVFSLGHGSRKWLRVIPPSSAERESPLVSSRMGYLIRSDSAEVNLHDSGSWVTPRAGESRAQRPLAALLGWFVFDVLVDEAGELDFGPSANGTSRWTAAQLAAVMAQDPRYKSAVLITDRPIAAAFWGIFDELAGELARQVPGFQELIVAPPGVQVTRDPAALGDLVRTAADGVVQRATDGAWIWRRFNAAGELSSVERTMTSNVLVALHQNRRDCYRLRRQSEESAEVADVPLAVIDFPLIVLEIALANGVPDVDGYVIDGLWDLPAIVAHSTAPLRGVLRVYPLLLVHLENRTVQTDFIDWWQSRLVERIARALGIARESVANDGYITSVALPHRRMRSRLDQWAQAITASDEAAGLWDVVESSDASDPAVQADGFLQARSSALNAMGFDPQAMVLIQWFVVDGQLRQGSLHIGNEYLDAESYARNAAATVRQRTNQGQMAGVIVLIHSYDRTIGNTLRDIALQELARRNRVPFLILNPGFAACFNEQGKLMARPVSAGGTHGLAWRPVPAYMGHRLIEFDHGRIGYGGHTNDLVSQSYCADSSVLRVPTAWAHNNWMPTRIDPRVFLVDLLCSDDWPESGPMELGLLVSEFGPSWRSAELLAADIRQGGGAGKPILIWLTHAHRFGAELDTFVSRLSEILGVPVAYPPADVQPALDFNHRYGVTVPHAFKIAYPAAYPKDGIRLATDPSGQLTEVSPDRVSVWFAPRGVGSLDPDSILRFTSVDGSSPEDGPAAHAMPSFGLFLRYRRDGRFGVQTNGGCMRVAAHVELIGLATTAAVSRIPDVHTGGRWRNRVWDPARRMQVTLLTDGVIDLPAHVRTLASVVRLGEALARYRFDLKIDRFESALTRLPSLRLSIVALPENGDPVPKSIAEWDVAELPGGAPLFPHESSDPYLTISERHTIVGDVGRYLDRITVNEYRLEQIRQFTVNAAPGVHVVEVPVDEDGTVTAVTPADMKRWRDEGRFGRARTLQLVAYQPGTEASMVGRVALDRAVWDALHRFANEVADRAGLDVYLQPSGADVETDPLQQLVLRSAVTSHAEWLRIPSAGGEAIMRYQTDRAGSLQPADRQLSWDRFNVAPSVLATPLRLPDGTVAGLDMRPALVQAKSPLTGAGPVAGPVAGPAPALPGEDGAAAARPLFTVVGPGPRIGEVHVDGHGLRARRDAARDRLDHWLRAVLDPPVMAERIEPAAMSEPSSAPADLAALLAILAELTDVLRTDPLAGAPFDPLYLASFLRARGWDPSRHELRIDVATGPQAGQVPLSESDLEVVGEYNRLARQVLADDASSGGRERPASPDGDDQDVDDVGLVHELYQHDVLALPSVVLNALGPDQARYEGDRWGAALSRVGLSPRIVLILPPLDEVGDDQNPALLGQLVTWFELGLRSHRELSRTRVLTRMMPLGQVERAALVSDMNAIDTSWPDFTEASGEPSDRYALSSWVDPRTVPERASNPSFRQQILDDDWRPFGPGLVSKKNGEPVAYFIGYLDRSMRQLSADLVPDRPDRPEPTGPRPFDLAAWLDCPYQPLDAHALLVLSPSGLARTLLDEQLPGRSHSDPSVMAQFLLPRMGRDIDELGRVDPEVADEFRVAVEAAQAADRNQLVAMLAGELLTNGHWRPSSGRWLRSVRRVQRKIRGAVANGSMESPVSLSGLGTAGALSADDAATDIMAARAAVTKLTRVVRHALELEMTVLDTVVVEAAIALRNGADLDGVVRILLAMSGLAYSLGLESLLPE
ncbi:MAG: hypothetical protein JWN95_418 [Frankiales bacterium]|nr:hypothetical protein [Frankiales bacterium]